MEPKTWQHRYLNAFVVYFLIGPVMGVAWNCIWYLLSNEIMYPENPEASLWISFVVGYATSFLAAYYQDQIYKFATGHGYFFFLVFSRVYSYAMFFVSGNAWRAIWEGMDYYTEISEKNALITGLSAYAILLLLRSSRQVVFAPCVLSMDFPIEDYFKAASYFGNKKLTGWARLGDTLFSVFFVGTLGFVVWRGFWEYMDFIIYPEDASKSGIASLVISYGILVVLAVIEPPMMWLSKKLYSTNYVIGLVFEDVVIFLYIIACINFWRGYGLLFDVYIPGGTLRYWLGHYVCCFVLFFTMAFNSVIARGCAAEGEEKDGQGVAAGIEYLDNFTQMFRSKPDTMKRSTCRNIFSCCSQAWQNVKDREDGEGEEGGAPDVVTISHKPIKAKDTTGHGADEVSLVTEKLGGKHFNKQPEGMHRVPTN